VTLTHEEAATIRAAVNKSLENDCNRGPEAAKGANTIKQVMLEIG
jgi:hypothetical protein